MTLKEKIENHLTNFFLDDELDRSDVADAILTLIRKVVDERKPTKMRKHESAVGFVQGYNQALKDFTDNLEKIWR